MVDATARYVIKADDQTNSAVENIKRSFASLDGAARKLSRGLKGLGLGAVALKAWSVSARLGDEAIRNLAASNERFAASLRESEAAMKSLWTAGDRTIETQEKLNTLLKDPGVQNSVSGLADRFGQLRLELKSLIPAWALFLRHGTDTKRVFDELAKVKPEGPQSRGSVRDLGDVDAAQKLGKSQNAAFDARMREQAKALTGQIEEVKISAVRLFDRSTATLGMPASAMDAADIEGTRFDQFGEQLNDVLEGTTQDFKNLVEASREASDSMQAYADEGMRGIQRSLAEFFLDPANAGIKGLGRSIVDVFRQTFANILAAKVASGLFGAVDAEGNLSGGLLSSGINALFGGGRASGGPVDMGRSYLVGERGPELFTPGRSGFITPNGAGAVTIYQNVDARGATVDAIKLLPSAMKAASDDAVARIHQQRKSGRL